MMKLPSASRAVPLGADELAAATNMVPAESKLLNEGN
jgi:hypothetical protein